LSEKLTLKQTEGITKPPYEETEKYIGYKFLAVVGT
jgi:hypothetical protein